MTRQRRGGGFAVGVLAALTVALGLLLAGCGRDATRDPASDEPAPTTSARSGGTGATGGATEATLTDDAYVWQETWTPAVVAAVGNEAEGVAIYRVLAATVTASPDAGLTARRVAVDWIALAGTDRAVELVVRCGDDFATALDAAQVEGTATALAGLMRDMEREAVQQGARASGFQIDFACPTARLAEYRVLLHRLATELAPRPLSITALPDWQTSDEYDGLVRTVAHYVLQAYSLERPSAFDEAMTLVDTDRLPGWLARADAAGRPYYVALPTSGYRLRFNAAGNYLGTASGDDDGGAQNDTRDRLLLADANAIAVLVQGLHLDPPARCRGIAWFRLPVTPDDLSWSSVTWEAVRSGRQPVVNFRAEVRPSATEAGVCDLWLSNAGETNLPGSTVALALVLDPGVRLAAYDLLNGFHVGRVDDVPLPFVPRQPSARSAAPVVTPPLAGQRGNVNDAVIRLVGPVPRLGEPRLAGWFRLDDSAAGTPESGTPGGGASGVAGLKVQSLEVRP